MNKFDSNLFEGFSEKAFINNLSAVSYTHLDVYKRQGYPFPPDSAANRVTHSYGIHSAEVIVKEGFAVTNVGNTRLIPLLYKSVKNMVKLLELGLSPFFVLPR